MSDSVDTDALLQQIIVAAIKPQLDGMYKQISEVKLNPSGFQTMDINTIFGNTKFVDTLKTYIDQQIGEMLKSRAESLIHDVIESNLEEFAEKVSMTKVFTDTVKDVTETVIENYDLDEKVGKVINDADMDDKIDARVDSRLDDQDFTQIIREALDACEITLRVQ